MDARVDQLRMDAGCAIVSRGPMDLPDAIRQIRIGA